MTGLNVWEQSQHDLHEIRRRLVDPEHGRCHWRPGEGRQRALGEALLNDLFLIGDRVSPHHWVSHDPIAHWACTTRRGPCQGHTMCPSCALHSPPRRRRSLLKDSSNAVLALSCSVIACTARSARAIAKGSEMLTACTNSTHLGRCPHKTLSYQRGCGNWKQIQPNMGLNAAAKLGLLYLTAPTAAATSQLRECVTRWLSWTLSECPALPISAFPGQHTRNETSVAQARCLVVRTSAIFTDMVLSSRLRLAVCAMWHIRS